MALLRAAVVTALTSLLLLLAVRPAEAHSTLVGSDPADGSVLAQAPGHATLRFDEEITVARAGTQLFTAAGRPLPVSATVRGRAVTVALPARLDDGTYTITWRVVSDDGDPVAGSVRFSIGRPSRTVVVPVVRMDSPRPVTALLWVARALLYAGLLSTTGLAFFRAWIATARRGRRRAARLRRAAYVTALLAYAGGVLAVPLTVLVQRGGELGALASSDTWLEGRAEAYTALATVLVGLALAVVTVALADALRPRPLRILATTAVVLPACGLALTGHSRAFTPHPLVVTLDVLHVAAGSIWVGGLLGLVLVLPGAVADERAQVLKRFSVLAATSVGVLVAAGVLLAWRIAGTWELLGTHYGRVLLAKVGFVLAALAYAAVNRELVRSNSSDRVGRELRTEAAVLVVVLALTALLVSQAPRGGGVPMPVDPPASSTSR